MLLGGPLSEVKWPLMQVESYMQYVLFFPSVSEAKCMLSAEAEIMIAARECRNVRLKTGFRDCRTKLLMVLACAHADNEAGIQEGKGRL